MCCTSQNHPLSLPPSHSITMLFSLHTQTFFLKSDSGLKSILEAANHNLKGLKCAKHKYLVMAYPDNALKIFLVSDMKVNVRKMVLSR